MKKPPTLTLVLPLVPLYEKDDLLYSYIEDTIKEILMFNDKLEVTLQESLPKLKTKIDLVNNYESPFESRWELRQALRFSVTLQQTGRTMTANVSGNKELSDLEKAELFLTIMKYNFADEVRSFLMLTQIARPATVKTSDWEFQVNDTTISRLPSFWSIHRECLPVIAELSWPKYVEISIADVLNWFTSKELSFDSFSRTATERALNAWTHLFPESRKGEEHDLVYSIMAIEALYSSRGRGIKAQIHDRTQLILGPLTKYNDNIKLMYKFRSDFFHGSVNIAPDSYGTGDNESRDYNEQIFKSTSIAVFILTVTLQFMVKNNLDRLSFKQHIS